MDAPWPAGHVEGARREGALVWLSAWRPRETAKVREAFMRRFPFIELDARLVTHPFDVIEEQARAARAAIDTAGPVSGTTVATLAERGWFASYVSPLARALPAVFYDADGRWYSTHSMGMAVAYNRELVPPGDVPQSYGDLLDPRWKGRILMEDLRGWGTSAEWAWGVLRTVGEAWFQGLARQELRWYREGAVTGALDMLRDGAAAIAPWSVDYMAQLRMDAGEPLGWTNPLRLGRVPANVILANAPHPYAARLFADWLLSEEGQTLIGRENLGFPALAGAPSYMAQSYPPGVEFAIAGPAEVARNKRTLLDLYGRVFFGG